MKSKLSVLIAIICFGSVHMHAQTIQDRASDGIADIRFAAKAGVNFSTLFAKNIIDISPKVGAYVGGMAEIPAFFENFYLQPELLLSFQGADIGIGNLNLNYVHLPLMAKYHITDEIAAEFGPQIGLLIGENGDDYGGYDTKSAHFGLNVGGGYRLNDAIYFQLRFGLGISKAIENPNFRNGVLSLGGAYFF